jgi:hypothetical protein
MSKCVLEKLNVETDAVQKAVEGLMYILLESSKRLVCQMAGYLFDVCT